MDQDYGQSGVGWEAGSRELGIEGAGPVIGPCCPAANSCVTEQVYALSTCSVPSPVLGMTLTALTLGWRHPKVGEGESAWGRGGQHLFFTISYFFDLLLMLFTS